MNDRTDQQLLRDYSGSRSEPAFAELVRRHVDLIYSAALRMLHDAHLAEDVTQSVFVALAQNAGRLIAHPVLSGWLHRTTINLAANALRSGTRRRAREQEAAAMHDLLSAEPNAVWEYVAPQLDAALDELSEPDRDALLLRYFERKSAREMAQTLGVSADAAQKRVDRAVDRLREVFSRRGITVGAGGLVVVISANAVHAAPAGLVVTISTTAALTGTTFAGAATTAAVKTIAMTTLQKTFIAATIAVAVGSGIYEARQASTLRRQVQTLQQQHEPLSQQIRQLQSERDNATRQLAALRDDNERLNQNTAELLKLRGEAARLRRDASQTNDPSVQLALAWLAKKEKLQKIFEDRPEQRIPELQFLTEKDWFNVVKDLDLDSEDAIRGAISVARISAKTIAAPVIQKALNKFIEAHNGNLPTDASQLKPFCDPPIDDAVLQRYKIIDKETTRSTWLEGMVLIERTAADEWREPQFAIGPMKTGLGPAPETVHLTFPLELKPVMESYQAQNPRKEFTDFNDLRPYITTPEQQTALEKIIKILQDNK